MCLMHYIILNFVFAFLFWYQEVGKFILINTFHFRAPNLPLRCEVIYQFPWLWGEEYLSLTTPTSTRENYCCMKENCDTNKCRFSSLPILLRFSLVYLWYVLWCINLWNFNGFFIFDTLCIFYPNWHIIIVLFSTMFKCIF